MREEVDICIIGGGVIGLACALNHIKAGKKVRLIDKQYAGSSRFNVGEIMLQGFSQDFLPFAAYGRLRWKMALEEHGQEVGYDRIGGVRLALSNRDVLKLKESTENELKYGFESEWIEDLGRIKEILKIERLPENLKGLKYSLHDAAIDTKQALDTLRSMLIQRGLLIWGSDEVADFIEENGQIIGVKTTAGDECVAGGIILAQGVRAGNLLEKIGVDLPIRPARVHILELMPTGTMPKQLIDHRERYGDIIIKYNAKTGRAIVSYTAERDPAQATYSLQEDPEMMAWLRRRAGEMLPALQNASLIETHVISIGVTPDRRPYIGQIEGQEKLFIAAGMSGRSHAFATGVSGYLGALMRGEEIPLDAVDTAAIKPTKARFSNKKQRIDAIAEKGGVTF